MTGLRQALRSHPRAAALILAAALLLRVLVPAGFMPSGGGGRFTLTLCPGAAPVVAAMPGMEHHGDRDATTQAPCAYADLALPALGGGDPVLLAGLLVFVLATGLIRRIPLPPRVATRLRPPLRGPPPTG